MTPTCVLDASALLALYQDEEGAAQVERAIVTGAAMSAVNMAEVLARLSDRGETPSSVHGRLADLGVNTDTFRVVPFDEDSARETAHLRRATTGSGLSLGDRACLALGRAIDAPVLTTDHAWSHLRLGVRVRILR